LAIWREKKNINDVKMIEQTKQNNDQRKNVRLARIGVLLCYLPILLYLLAEGIVILHFLTGITFSWGLTHNLVQLLNLLFYVSAISAYVVIPAGILFFIYLIVRRRIISAVLTLPSFPINILPVYIVLYENGGYMITA